MKVVEPERGLARRDVVEIEGKRTQSMLMGSSKKEKKRRRRKITKRKTVASPIDRKEKEGKKNVQKKKS